MFFSGRTSSIFNLNLGQLNITAKNKDFFEIDKKYKLRQANILILNN